MRVGNAIYMDYQSTTPLDPEVRAAMLPYMEDRFGNPHSSSHRFGWEAEAAVDVGRGRVAQLLDVDPANLYFTAGATESNNIAIKGLALGRRGRMITLATEHSCVLESTRASAQFGSEPVILPVEQDGLINLGQLEDALTEDTVAVSVMAVNNEIGVIQPIEQIAALTKSRGIWLHCDAAQAYGKIHVTDLAKHADLISLSGHKIYGPKGIGALYVAPEAKRQMGVLMSGGGQEGMLRSGTLAPALCAGFGQAALLAEGQVEAEMARAQRHFDQLMAGFEAMGVPYQLNGHADTRLKSNLNLSFEGHDSARLMANLRRLAVSSGAACASAKEGPSYVLEALGVPAALAEASLRIGTGRFTDDAQVDDALGYLEDALTKSRRKSWSK